MSKEILIFEDIGIEKNKFYRHKIPIQILRKYQYLTRFILVEKTISTLLVTFIYHKVKPLHIMLLKRSAYGNSYDQKTKWMYFLIEDGDFKQKIKT